MQFLDGLEKLIYAFLSTLLVLIIMILTHIINHNINQQKAYLNTLGEVTQSQLRSPLGRLQRLSLIINLNFMKKFIGIAILAIVLTGLTLTTFVIFDSRTYFKQYFEVQRQKLNLRSEKSVDSLLLIIHTKDKKVDSLALKQKSDSIFLVEKIKLQQKTNADLKSLIKLYQTEASFKQSKP